jgi:hypothetical protein
MHAQTIAIPPAVQPGIADDQRMPLSRKCGKIVIALKPGDRNCFLTLRPDNGLKHITDDSIGSHSTTRVPFNSARTGHCVPPSAAFSQHTRERSAGPDSHLDMRREEQRHLPAYPANWCLPLLIIWITTVLSAISCN